MKSSEILSKLNYSKELVELSKGIVKVPEYTFEAPFDPTYGFPPVLIPVWSHPDWPGYIGLVKHWFGNESDSFAQFFAEDHLFVEIAYGLDQLKAWMVFDFLCEIPEIDEVGIFSESIGFCTRDNMEEIFEGCEKVSDLASLNIFNYKIPNALRVEDDSGLPDWALNQCSEEDIDTMISEGQYEKAWYCLNSSNYNKERIVKWLEELSPHSFDPNAFKSLVKFWVSKNLINT